MIDKGARCVSTALAASQSCTRSLRHINERCQGVCTVDGSSFPGFGFQHISISKHLSLSLHLRLSLSTCVYVSLFVCLSLSLYLCTSVPLSVSICLPMPNRNQEDPLLFVIMSYCYRETTPQPLLPTQEPPASNTELNVNLLLPFILSLF